MKETFFAAFFSLVRLFLNTKDDFLKQKLVEKTKRFFDAAQSPSHVVQLDFTTYKSVVKSSHIVQHGNNVAQCDYDFLKSIDELNELIEILIHLETVSPSPALLAQKNLLRLRSEIMDSVPAKDLKEEKEANPLPKLKNKALNSKYKNLESEILQFFKNKPEGLSLREIIPFLPSHCSRRTLQRHLNKLVAIGVLLKRRDKNSVKYNATLHGAHVHGRHVVDNYGK